MTIDIQRFFVSGTMINILAIVSVNTINIDNRLFCRLKIFIFVLKLQSKTLQFHMRS